MPNNVYSSQFFLVGPDDALPSFLVPDGFTAVVRDLSIWSDGVAGGCQLLIQDSEAAEQVVVAYVQTIDPTFYAQWTGRVVVPGGGEMTLALVDLGLGVHIYAGGYLLRDDYS